MAQPPRIDEQDARRRGRITKQDIDLPRRRMSLKAIERMVEARYGLASGALRVDAKPDPSR